MPTRLLYGLIGGLACGALFGVAFGALASVFDGGPSLLVGISESWWWFAAAGAFIGVGWMRAAVNDRQTSRPLL
jgi:hypothetical protein